MLESEGGGGVEWVGVWGEMEVQMQDVVSLRAQAAVRRTIKFFDVVTRRSWLEAGWLAYAGHMGQILDRRFLVSFACLCDG